MICDFPKINSNSTSQSLEFFYSQFKNRAHHDETTELLKLSQIGMMTQIIERDGETLWTRRIDPNESFLKI